MARELVTTWDGYQSGLDRLLAIACRTLCIYDEDLVQLKLEAPNRQKELKRLLQQGKPDSLQIAVRNATHLRQHSPLLIGLLETFSHCSTARETGEGIAHLRDCMVIVDGKHALIRFEKDLPRSKLLIDEAEELHPYLNRFSEIWNEGGDPVSSSTLGL